MKNYLPVILGLITMIIPRIMLGQDPHLSQYYHTPIFVNPANIGQFEGKARLQANYRQQWASITNPFLTSAAFADFSLGNMGIGLEFMSDGVGDYGLNHTNVLVGFGYRLDLGQHNLNLGIKGGFIQKSLDPNKFSFDNQYIPGLGFDPTLPNGEGQLTSRVSVGDFHSGILYQYRPEESGTLMGIDLGVSFSHINQPNLSLFNGEAALPMKTMVYGSLKANGGERITLNPVFLYAVQGSAREIIPGLLIDYEFDQEVFAHFGANYRFGDALIPYIGLSFNHMRAGLSYDVNISRLSEFSNLRGGMELSLSYVFNNEPSPKTNYKARKSSSFNDQDKDGIKDRNDLCPDIPGVRKFNGCPDSDGDGIVDSEDVCPTIPGPRERNGCPAFDRDGDGVLDNSDDCPDTPGLIAFKGCPDTDNDGLPDHVDKCPEEAGPRVRSGCPSSDIDADGDGIPDKVDMCPTVMGSADFQGCPDTDKDGLADFEDLCPAIPGPKEGNGCPLKAIDSDKDGIIDSEDKCPSIAGVKAFQGCPDSDGDGLDDFSDECPLTPGKITNKGCPDDNFDVDGDGILNQNDHCPYVPGLVQFQGCPDTDKDGISDLEDGCPAIAGPVSNQGCPIQGQTAGPVQMEGVRTGSLPKFGPVEFDTDQAIIKTQYFSMLNELSDYLITHPELKLLVAGHTDAEGNAHYNMMLGQNRSQAILYYLTVRGVDASRISMLSYGEIMPKTDNETMSGKARNRRAELILTR